MPTKTPSSNSPDNHTKLDFHVHAVLAQYTFPTVEQAAMYKALFKLLAEKSVKQEVNTH